MPNLASVLKTEVARLARKELRQVLESHRKAVAAHRTDIAALKRRVADLERQLKTQSKAATKATPKSTASVAEGDSDGAGLRFRPAGMASNRKRLGLSAQDFGLLVGATGQSVYLWEQGKAKPRQQALAAIAALRGAGKKEVAARLAALKAAPG